MEGSLLLTFWGVSMALFVTYFYEDYCLDYYVAYFTNFATYFVSLNAFKKLSPTGKLVYLIKLFSSSFSSSELILSTLFV